VSRPGLAARYDPFGTGGRRSVRTRRACIRAHLAAGDGEHTFCSTDSETGGLPMEGRPEGQDVLIVGAGVVGAALAYEVARRGRRVLVVDRATAPAFGATRWSMGGTHWLAAATDDRLRDLCREGLDRHQGLSEEIGTDSGFRPRPILVLAQDEVALAGLVPLVENGRAHGFEGRIVGAAELAYLEPTLTPGVAVGAAFCDLGWVDTQVATRAWLQGAAMHGAQFRSNVEVRSIHADGPTPRVETSEGPIEAGQVILTAGAWIGRLLREAGSNVPLVHTHAEVVESEPQPPIYRHVVIAVTPTEKSRGTLETAIAQPGLRARFEADDGTDLGLPNSVEIGVVQQADGRVRLGQISRGISGFLDGPRPDGEAAIRSEVARFYPELAKQPGQVHSRPVSFSADRLPVVGAVPRLPGYWLVTGLVSPLIYLPALAPRMAAALAGESVPELAPFAPDRLLDGPA
jgi:glycine/D-amino acid oxidase-like deaminating enzyme